MASDEGIIDNPLIGEIKEGTQQLQNVEFDVDYSAKDEHPTIQQLDEGSLNEGSLNSYTYTGPKSPISIDSNFNVVIVNIISCGKGTCGDEVDALKVASSKDLAANINIINNYGLVVVTSNGEFNFDGKPNKAIEYLKLIVQDRNGISEDRQQTPLDDNRPCESQPNKNVKDVSRNRSEFCLEGNASRL